MLGAAKNPGGVVYGTITIGALLAAENARQETYADTVEASLVALALYWLAHSYAHALGDGLATGQRLTARSYGRAFVYDAAILRGAAAPVLAMLLAWVIGASLSTAVNAAIWTAVASVVVWQILAGVRARLTASALVLDVAVGAVLGLGILAIKLLLH